MALLFIIQNKKIPYSLHPAMGGSIFDPFIRENPRRKQSSKKWIWKQSLSSVVPKVIKICEASQTDFPFHRPLGKVQIKISSKSIGSVALISSSIGESDGSNKKCKGYVFLYTLPYG